MKDSKNIVAEINRLKAIGPDSREPSDRDKLELMVNSYLVHNFLIFSISLASTESFEGMWFSS